MLDQNQRRQLLKIARDSITAVFERRRPEIDIDQYDEALRTPAGAFVTLEKGGEPRGCIGSIHAAAPLAQAVSSSAISAAFRDPRFLPLAADELP